MYRKMLLLIAFVVLSAPLPATTINVPADYATIQAGIDVASDGDLVLVADGTYYENINFKGKAITVASHFLVDEDTTHINNAIINGSRPSDPNKGSVVSFTSGEDTTSVICGFTITGGTGTVAETSRRVAGGIYLSNSGARINHNKIVFNSVNHSKDCQGGGIGYNRQTNTSARYVIVENNVIESNSLSSNNTAEGYQDGGGVYLVKGRATGNIIRYNSVGGKPRFSGGGGIAAGCEDDANRTLVIISGNTITHNKVYAPGYQDYGGGWGGGVDVVFANVQIISNTISHNEAGGNNGVGAGIRLWRSKEISLIKDNIISYNSITALTAYGWAGGIELWQTEGVHVIDNIIEGNNAGSAAGGIDESGCSRNLISGNFIKSNTGGEQGGGIWAMNGKIINNVIVENEARRGGGIFYYYHPSFGSNVAQIINNTLTKNVADTAGSIAIYRANAVVMNTISWGNSAPHGSEIELWGGTLNAAYSDIQFGVNGIAIDSVATVNWLAGNVDANPLFAFPDHQLSNSSPCIGAGVGSLQIGATTYNCPSSDIEGTLRPNPPGSMPDVGAYENLLGTSSGPILVPDHYATIQAGINAAQDGDIVLVADGTYYENINFKGKAITVASHFLIDGDTTHVNNTIINGSRPSDPNNGSVVSFVTGEDTTSVIYGFTITGGTGTLYDSNNRVGGGIYCKNSGARICHNKIVNNSVTYTQSNKSCFGGGIGLWPLQNPHNVIIQDNVIESNSVDAGDISWGGGIFLIKGKIIHNMIRQNKSKANYSWGHGGGISATCHENVINRPLVIIAENTITNNQAFSSSTTAEKATLGGGVDIQYNNIRLIYNTITHNSVGASASQRTQGGGVRIFGVKDSALVQDNTISFNFYSNAGICAGGGLNITNSDLSAKPARVTIKGNRFEGNKGVWGGGLRTAYNPGSIVSDNEFIGNFASEDGGGICDVNSNSFTISNNRFIKNQAIRSGGGLYASDGDILIVVNNIITENQSGSGGGILLERSWYPEVARSARIINNTITANVANSAGGIGMLEYKVIIMNTICWGNVAPFDPEMKVQGGELSVAYSDIRLGADSIGVWSRAKLNWLEGNIDADPLFAGTLFHLSDNSPCIGAGIHSYDFGGGIVYTCPSTDYNGNLRPNPVDAYLDMGAIESEYPRIGNDIAQRPEQLPTQFSLAQNYPNPFNPSTTIEFALPKSAFVTLKVYNLLGEAVAILVAEQRAAGIHKLNWDASGLASGVYLYQLEAGNFVQSKKLVLMR